MIGAERLGSDGGRAVQTPLATLHKFQGAADAFLTTPADGLRDVHVKLSAPLAFAPAPAGADGSARAALALHAFTADTDGRALGREFDLSVSAPLTREARLGLSLARFEGETGGPASRTKLFATLAYAW